MEGDNSMSDYPWIAFKLRGKNFCITCENVVTMKAPEGLTAVLDSEPYLLGLMRLSGETIPVLGLRALLGMPSLQSDLDSFGEIKQKHLAWLDELVRSVREGEPFFLPLDKRECELGQWYYGFRTDNYNLKRIAEQIERPHDKIHRLAREIEDCRASGQAEPAARTLEQIQRISERELLPLLCDLNGTYRDINRGIAIVLESPTAKTSIQVDRILAVDGMEDADQRKDAGLASSRLVKSVLSTAKGDIYLEIDADLLFEYGATASVK